MIFNDSNNPLFELISLLGATGPVGHLNRFQGRDFAQKRGTYDIGNGSQILLIMLESQKLSCCLMWVYYTNLSTPSKEVVVDRSFY